MMAYHPSLLRMLIKHTKQLGSNLFIAIFTCLLFIITNAALAQSAKDFYRAGIEAQKKDNCPEAIKQFSSAITAKPNYTDAYLQRGNCYFKMKEYEFAIMDYLFLNGAHPMKEDYIIKCGITYLAMQRYADAQAMLLKLEIPEINLHVAEAKTMIAKCKIMMKNFEEAISYLSDNQSMFNDDDQLFYYKGIACDSLKDYQNAAFSYVRSIQIIDEKIQKKEIKPKTADSLKIIYLNSLGESQCSLFDFTSAKESYSKLIVLKPADAVLHLKRAQLFYQLNQLNDALEDLKICDSLKLRTYLYFYTKSKVLKKAGQFNLAVESLQPIIGHDTAFYANYLQAQCYESIGKFVEAQQSFNQAGKKVPDLMKKEYDASVKRIKNRVYEMKRETDSPTLKITSPPLDIDGKILISKSSRFVELKGVIDDSSPIKSITINDIEAEFSRDSINPRFRSKINLLEKSAIRIKVLDVYSNLTDQTFEFNRSEKNKPGHKLFVSYSEKDKEVFFDKAKQKIFAISGKVEDESLIKQIMINNVSASFNPNELNPVFEASVDVSRSDSLVISITDEYNNKSRISYHINVRKAAEMAQSPMGKTWLVFIANSNYESFGTLTGPDKDLNSVRDALLQYKFDNVIAKRNMTLSEMEKFFRIELRDLIKEQSVQSIMIWFAGHGKYLNETGYWIPVNAVKDDEITYYPIPYLKSNLNSYGKSLKNILIVSDACESGPSFSLSNEEVPNFDCGKISDTGENSSAYVFSSTTNEKASDNSVFCESFTSMLNTNKQSCISMSEMVKFVSGVVQKRQSQRCRYGKIKDIGENTGNFFFLKR